MNFIKPCLLPCSKKFCCGVIDTIDDFCLRVIPSVLGRFKYPGKMREILDVIIHIYGPMMDVAVKGYCVQVTE